MAKKVKTVEERRQQRRSIEALKKQQQAEEIGPEEEILEDDLQDGDLPDSDSEEVAPEVAEKDDYNAYGGYSQEPMGPTSFAELDAAEAAQEQADELSDASWDVRQLVRNILNHPMMDPKEKASAIQSVGSDFEQRVTDILSGAPEVETKDMDVLTIDAILAQDKRHTNILEELMDKAKLTTGSRKKLSDGQFALPDKKKYPIHDKAHVRNALARAAQQIKAGGTGASDAKSALPAIHAAAKKMGIGMSHKEKGGIIIEKDKKGDWRYVAWPTNNFIDSDGDIFCEAAHKEYIEFLDKNPDMAPAFMTWHIPETMRKNLPDFWTYENGFLIFSGVLTEGEAQVLLKAQAETDIGLSQGVLGFGRDINDPRVVTQYRMYEFSDLPLHRASNPFTTLEIAAKEAKMQMKDEEKIEYLSKVLKGGREQAIKLISGQTAAAQQALKEAGIDNKEKTETPAPATTPAAASVAPGDAHIMELAEAVLKEKIDPDALNTYLEDLQKEVTEGKQAKEEVALLKAAIEDLNKSSDDKLAEKISPPITRVWMAKAKSKSVSDESVIGPDEVAPGKEPGGDWLSEATGTEPLKTA